MPNIDSDVLCTKSQDERFFVSTWDPSVVTVGWLCAQTQGYVFCGEVTEAGAVLTPPAVSGLGMKI